MWYYILWYILRGFSADHDNKKAGVNRRIVEHHGGIACNNRRPSGQAFLNTKDRCALLFLISIARRGGKDVL